MKTLSEIIKAEQANKGYYTGAIRIWEAVEIVTKKDGQPFAVYSRNFKNARIENDFCGYKISVYGRDDNNKWLEDWIKINATDENGKHTGEPLPVETVKGLIEKTIEQYKENAARIERRIEKAETVYNLVVNTIDNLTQEINRLDTDNSHLGYIAADLMENAGYEIRRATVRV